MAGTVVRELTFKGSESINRYALAWTSNASGAVSANPADVVTGQIIAVKFLPSLAGTQPSDQYDVTLLDTDGIDLLGGAGANRSNAAGQLLQSDPPVFFEGGKLDLVIANAGNAKTGTVVLYVL